MKIVVTGAAGFLGSRLADAILREPSPLPITSLLLTDTLEPAKRQDPRVTTLALDITSPGAAKKLLANCDILFHLAAIVSGTAEKDLDTGLRVNFDATRAILEEARAQRHSKATPVRLVFASTCGVFGGPFPSILTDTTAAMPQSSYGTAKAMCELLINDYSRRGFIDGRMLRLPTVTVRAGLANTAVTSFASGIIREPLNGEESICPVSAEQHIWITSPSAVIQNFIHASKVDNGKFGEWRAVNLPGLCVTVAEMIDALRSVAGEEVANLVKFQRDEFIAKLVASFPLQFDNSRALSLGFSIDNNFADIVRSYIRDDLKPRKA